MENLVELVLVNESRTDEGLALIEKAEKAGRADIAQYLRSSSKAMLPSAVELKAKFGGDLLQ